jgi:hypothetical protein
MPVEVPGGSIHKSDTRGTVDAIRRFERLECAPVVDKDSMGF